MDGGSGPNRPLDFERLFQLKACLEERGLDLRIKYVETVAVKAGVTCDVYEFDGCGTHDLAIVEVCAGEVTPLQRVLSGTETVEGHIAGRGTLAIGSGDGTVSTYEYRDGGTQVPTVVEVGQVMRWHADTGETLVFFELCAPPYAEGRFENDCARNMRWWPSLCGEFGED
jgi:hypothetical protein